MEGGFKNRLELNHTNFHLLIHNTQARGSPQVQEEHKTTLYSLLIA